MNDAAPDSAARPALGDDRPVIRCTPEIHIMRDAAIRALAAGPCEIYQRGAELTRIVRATGAERPVVRGPADPEDPWRNRRRPGSPFVRALELATLKPVLSASARWERFNPKTEEWRHSKPDNDAAAALLREGSWAGVRWLEGIIEAPALRPDGTIIEAEGYDDRTGYVLVPGDAFVPVADRPTRADAQRALAELLHPLLDFPHVGEPDARGAACGPARSAWIAALLTLLARPAIEGSIPAWVFDASTRGSGKSLQADALTIIATGRAASRMNWPNEDDELEKILGSFALGGDPLICFDNIVRSFGGGPLDRCLTAVDTVQLRVLGRSQVPTLPWRAIVMATGNNVELKGDTSRRALVVRLESLDEHPEDRTAFRIPGGAAALRAWCVEHRPRLVRAALTILRAWFVAGRPREGARTWGSFEGWAAIIPPALTWAGAADPLDARPTVAGLEDLDKAALRVVIDSWPRLEALIEGAPGAPPSGRGITLRKALDQLYRDQVARAKADLPPDGFDDLREALEEMVPPKGSPVPDTRKIGLAFRDHRLRVIDGRRLEPVQGDKGAGQGSARWRVVAI